MKDSNELYKIYADWTGQLHHWVQTKLGRHIDCEYFPDSYQFKLYSGSAEPTRTTFAFNEDSILPISTVPNLARPSGEAAITVQLPKPEEDPTRADLDEAFRGLCLAAARLLEIDLKRPQLEEKKHAFKRQGSPRKHPEVDDTGGPAHLRPGDSSSG
jgi:hypothetical protein